MGYTTDFYGSFKLNKELTPEDYQWLDSFNDERHEGDEYPSYYCQWKPTEDMTAVEWDGGEKFYEYVEWLKWLIDNFFTERGYVLNGEVEWEGEEHGDIGKIVVTDNVVTVHPGRIFYA